MSDLIAGLKALQGGLLDCEKSDRYYNGTQPEFFASARLRRALQRTGVGFRLNVCRPVVMAVNSRLEIAGLTSNNPHVSDLLDGIWEDNELELVHQDISEAALVFGESYVIVWPNEDDDTKVDVHLNTPDTMRLFYDPENPRIKDFAIKAWKVGQKTRVNLYYADRIEKYVSRAQSTKRDADFDRYLDDDIDDDAVEGTGEWPIPNPYGEVPVFHFRTQRPYGRPEHADAFAVQDMINKLTITLMATVDTQGFPQRYFISEGGPGDALVDTVFQQAGATDLNEDGTPKSDGGKHQLDATPGGVWELYGKGSIGQFPAADLKTFTDASGHLVGMLAAMTSTPQHYFDALTGVVSGESLRAAEAPLVKKVKLRQKSFGATWQQALGFALDVLGEGGDDPVIGVHWAPALSASDVDFWRGVQAKEVAGVPVRQALAESGYTDSQLDEFGIDMSTVPFVVDNMKPAHSQDSKVVPATDPLVHPGTDLTLGVTPTAGSDGTMNQGVMGGTPMVSTALLVNGGSKVSPQ